MEFVNCLARGQKPWTQGWLASTKHCRCPNCEGGWYDRVEDIAHYFKYVAANKRKYWAEQRRQGAVRSSFKKTPPKTKYAKMVDRWVNQPTHLCDVCHIDPRTCVCVDYKK